MDARDQISWRNDRCDVNIGVDWIGIGPIILLLPAFISISTQCEMHPLQEQLADLFTTAAVD
jgi:hypothetical protein